MASSDELLARMNTQLRDPADNAFSEAEKLEALTQAVEDDYVYVITEDSTLTTVYHRRQYTQLDSSYTSILDAGIDLEGFGFPKPLPGEAYTFVDGNLNITNRFKELPAGKKLYLTVAKKLTINDEIPDSHVGYVLNLAVANCAQFLVNIKLNRFLKNDTTMAELVQAINAAQSKAQTLRRTLQNKYMVRL